MYPVTNFIEKNESQLKYSKNLSISIMSLSDEVLNEGYGEDYNNLCNLTREGMYVNIVDKGLKADWLAE